MAETVCRVARLGGNRGLATGRDRLADGSYAHLRCAVVDEHA